MDSTVIEQTPPSNEAVRWPRRLPDGKYRPENSRDRSAPVTREGSYDGAKYRASTGLVEVKTEAGVAATIRMIVVDFRSDETKTDNQVFIGCSGFPGFTKSLRSGIMENRCDDPKVNTDLDFLMVQKAKECGGVAFLPEMEQLPKGKGEPTFTWDGDAIITGVEKFSNTIDSNRSVVFGKNVKEVSFSGYSNGAGEVRAAAAHICEKYPLGSGPENINLRMYSLIGVVPIEQVIEDFGSEVKGMALLEIANRLHAVKPDSEFIDPTIPGNDKVLIERVWHLIVKEPGGWNKFMEQLRASAKAEGGGNLQIGLDLLSKISRDVGRLGDHLKKYARQLDPQNLDKRVTVELVLPAFDRMMWSGLRKTMKHLQEIDDALPFIDLSRMLKIDPSWEGWRDLFPNVNGIKVSSVGENLSDPASTHTGPPLSLNRTPFLNPSFSTNLN